MGNSISKYTLDNKPCLKHGLLRAVHFEDWAKKKAMGNSIAKYIAAIKCACG
jgi:hypothetical protein